MVGTLSGLTGCRLQPQPQAHTVRAAQGAGPHAAHPHHGTTHCSFIEATRHRCSTAPHVCTVHCLYRICIATIRCSHMYCYSFLFIILDKYCLNEIVVETHLCSLARLSLLSTGSFLHATRPRCSSSSSSSARLHCSSAAAALRFHNGNG